MNEEHEAPELLDLGDAAEETRQGYPFPRYSDSQFGFGTKYG